MKFFQIPLLTLFILLACTLSTHAAGQIAVYLYKADPSAPEGFTETYRWRMNASDEWRRFEYMMTKMKPAAKEHISPFVKKPAELLILSVKEANGITGKDYYLTADGVTVVTIYARNSYYKDSKDLFKLLKEQVIEKHSFEKFPGEKVANDEKGIVIRYLINKDLPNPAWLIETQKDVNLYDSFLRKLPGIGDAAFQINNPFEEKGNFILLLNYPKAPGDFVTVGPAGIRISKMENEDTYLKDEKKYYKYFYGLTQDSLKMKSDVQKRDDAIKERGNF